VSRRTYPISTWQSVVRSAVLQRVHFSLENSSSDTDKRRSDSQLAYQLARPHQTTLDVIIYLRHVLRSSVWYFNGEVAKTHQ
jgi:hypothetical protein